MDALPPKEANNGGIPRQLRLSVGYTSFEKPPEVNLSEGSATPPEVKLPEGSRRTETSSLPSESRHPARGEASRRKPKDALPSGGSRQR